MGRKLFESEVINPTGSPLRIDRDAGIIYGVRALGAESRNTHGERGVEATEYAESAHDDAVRLYENLAVPTDHVIDPKVRGRSVADPFGQLRNCRKSKDEQGRTITVGDLHYYRTHPLAERVLEDVERQIGNYGLSHNAVSSRERVDLGRKRLVIEGLASAKSIDLVFRPASNRNLYESQEPPMTKKPFRALIEQLMAGFENPAKGKPKLRKVKWCRHLLEDDSMMGEMSPMAAEVEAEGEDPEEAIEEAFCTAVAAVVRGEGTAEEKLAKIEVLLTAQEALDGEGDAETEPEEEEDPAPGAKVEQLNDNAAAELAALRGEKAVRQLCEQEDFTPNEIQVEALVGINDVKKRRKLIEQFRATAKRPNAPKSGGGSGSGGGMPTGDAWIAAAFSR